MLSADHQFDLFPCAAVPAFLLQLLAEPSYFILPQRNPYLAHIISRCELAQRTDEDRSSGELGELLGKMRLGVPGARQRCHTRPKTCGGNNDDDLHGGL